MDGVRRRCGGATVAPSTSAAERPSPWAACRGARGPRPMASSDALSIVPFDTLLAKTRSTSGSIGRRRLCPRRCCLMHGRLWKLSARAWRGACGARPRGPSCARLGLRRRGRRAACLRGGDRVQARRWRYGVGRRVDGAYGVGRRSARDPTPWRASSWRRRTTAALATAAVPRAEDVEERVLDGDAVARRELVEAARESWSGAAASGALDRRRCSHCVYDARPPPRRWHLRRPGRFGRPTALSPRVVAARMRRAAAGGASHAQRRLIGASAFPRGRRVDPPPAAPRAAAPQRAGRPGTRDALGVTDTGCPGPAPSVQKGCPRPALVRDSSKLSRAPSLLAARPTAAKTSATDARSAEQLRTTAPASRRS